MQILREDTVQRLHINQTQEAECFYYSYKYQPTKLQSAQ